MGKMGSVFDDDFDFISFSQSKPGETRWTPQLLSALSDDGKRRACYEIPKEQCVSGVECFTDQGACECYATPSMTRGRCIEGTWCVSICDDCCFPGTQYQHLLSNDPNKKEFKIGNSCANQNPISALTDAVGEAKDCDCTDNCVGQNEFCCPEGKFRTNIDQNNENEGDLVAVEAGGRCITCDSSADLFMIVTNRDNQDVCVCRRCDCDAEQDELSDACKDFCCKQSTPTGVTDGGSQGRRPPWCDPCPLQAAEMESCAPPRYVKVTPGDLTNDCDCVCPNGKIWACDKECKDPCPEGQEYKDEGGVCKCACAGENQIVVDCQTAKTGIPSGCKDKCGGQNQYRVFQQDGAWKCECGECGPDEERCEGQCNCDGNCIQKCADEGKRSTFCTCCDDNDRELVERDGIKRCVFKCEAFEFRDPADDVCKLCTALGVNFKWCIKTKSCIELPCNGWYNQTTCLCQPCPPCSEFKNGKCDPEKTCDLPGTIGPLPVNGNCECVCIADPTIITANDPAVCPEAGPQGPVGGGGGGGDEGGDGDGGGEQPVTCPPNAIDPGNGQCYCMAPQSIAIGAMCECPAGTYPKPSGGKCAPGCADTGNECNCIQLSFPAEDPSTCGAPCAYIVSKCACSGGYVTGGDGMTCVDPYNSPGGGDGVGGSFMEPIDEAPSMCDGVTCPEGQSCFQTVFGAECR